MNNQKKFSQKGDGLFYNTAPIQPRDRRQAQAPIPPRAPTPSPGHASRPRLRSSVIQQQRRDFDTLVEPHRTVRGLVLQPRLDIDARR